MCAMSLKLMLTRHITTITKTMKANVFATNFVNAISPG